MVAAGGALRRCSKGGETTGARSRRARAATAAAVAALTACAAQTAARPSRTAEAQAVMAHVEAGLDLYEAREFVLAARRFNEAAAGAKRCGDLPMQTRTVTAECTAWLRARRLSELDECTGRLEALRARDARPSPGVNTLLALGAVAGRRPLPPYQIPSAVRPLLPAAAQEPRR